MNQINAAAIRRLKNLFHAFQQDVNKALKELEHANNVYSCTVPGMEAIIGRVASHYRIDVSDVMSRKRDSETVWARQVCMYIAVKTTSYTKQRIGELFFRDHTTVIHAQKVVENRMGTDKRVKAEVEELLK